MARGFDKPLHDTRFPNESPAYREARNNLLRAEIDLRRQIERVAALRRALPLGGDLPQDYVFDAHADDGATRPARLSELFGDKNTLVAYSYMFSPSMAQPCPSCTSMLDSLDGAAAHLAQRISLVVIAKSPLPRVRAVAAARGWSHLRIVSSAGNSYNRDYKGETPDGRQLPSLNVFVRRDGKIRHFFHSELMFAPADAGQHPRHIDLIWPLWNVLDITPEGRGTDWYPQLSYGETQS